MAALGVWALAIGVADLTVPIDPDQGGAWRMWCATAVLPALAALGAAGIGLGRTELLLLVGLTLLTGFLWLWLWRRGAPRLGLAVFAATFVGLLMAAGRWTPGESPLASLLEGSLFAAAGHDRVALVVGLAILLVATGNRVVRIVLTEVENGLLGQEEQLKGGRVIGPLERLLIFGLGISGQLIAAGLVVTAKSLLRFSELRGSREGISGEQGPPRAELMSEYLLVGSLLSWSLAFVAIGVAAAAVGG